MIKENQRITLTKLLIKEGMLRLLKIKSLDKINVTELCRESGINRATFYRHYETPRDVLIDMQIDLADEFYRSFPQPLTVKESKAYLENLCQYLFDHSELIKIFIYYNSEEDVTSILESFFNNLLMKQKENIKELSSLDEESLKLVGTCLVGGGYFLLRKWLLEDIQKTPQEMADLIWRFIEQRMFF